MLDTSGLKEEYKELYEYRNDRAAAFNRLCDIIRILRGLCPWDREQTHESLRPCMIEEAYEAVDAINRRDFDNLREELGDVMLQAIFHCQLAEEENRFDMTAVINEECEKMIRRHPHIFSDEGAKTVDKALEKWENIKVKEHGNIAASQRLKDVPKALPALTRSAKVQKRAADVGFDWPDVRGALDKVEEEFKEFNEARGLDDKASMTDELGDLLFSVVNVARFSGIDPEEALNASTAKFISRFSALEDQATSMGLKLKEMSLEEMDQLWEQIKNLPCENSKEDLQ